LFSSIQKRGGCDVVTAVEHWTGIAAIVVPIVGAVIGFIMRFEHRMTRVETLLSMIVGNTAGRDETAEIIKAG